MTKETKHYKRLACIFSLLSILATLVPITIYIIIAFVNGTIGEKVSLGICLVTVLIFTIINILLKHRIRCTIWILLLGIHACVANIKTLLIIMAITTAIDEFIFEPLAKKYKNKYIINKEIDKRG